MANYPRGPRDYFNPAGMPQFHTHRAPGLHSPWPGGALGIDAQTSPIVPIDQSGKEHLLPKDSTFKPPVVVCVDSEDRDIVAYPDPTFFRLRFPKPMRGVFSIELLNLQIPNANSAPTDNFILLKSPELSRFEVMHSTNTTAGEPANSNIAEAFAKIPYVTTLPYQVFTRRELIMKKYFSPPEDKLLELTFELTDKYGDRYGMALDENWTACLEIVCFQ